MKQAIRKIFFIAFAFAMMAPVTLLAQNRKVEVTKDKKEAEQIVITRKNNSDDKVVIEINGDKVTVNGKPVDENDKDGDVSVRRRKIRDTWAYSDGNGMQSFSFNDLDENTAMLGVTTEKSDDGAEIQSVNKESGAEKAGLKKGDVIFKIDETKIEDADDLTKAIRAHKPGDKITVNYLRDGKKQSVTAELGKWKGVKGYKLLTTPDQSYGYSIPDMNFSMPRIQSIPRARAYGGGQSLNGFLWNNGAPKLGMSVEDTDDGKGVNVIYLDEDANAYKAGIRQDDVITEIDGKSVNGADEVAKIVKDSKDKTSIKVKVQRAGKTQDFDVKMPRKLKTADL